MSLVVCIDQETKRPLEMILCCEECGALKYKSSLLNFEVNWELTVGSSTEDYCEYCEGDTNHTVIKKGTVAPIIRR